MILTNTSANNFIINKNNFPENQEYISLKNINFPNEKHIPKQEYRSLRHYKRFLQQQKNFYKYNLTNK
ncbi:MAG: hypothetical protein Q8784_01650 [Vigna little leaf phytoplasma]|nr:hypothetical protein [Vigna little leaf phytoplasma]